MKFFAYGVHMLTPKMVSMIAFARAIGVGELSGYKLVFNKKSHKDESGLANLMPTQNARDKVYGVIYEFSDSNRSTLDLMEGTEYGYHATPVTVLCDAEKMSVTTYLCGDPQYWQEGLKPFDWYQAMMVKGARQNNLPEAYIKHLESRPHVVDTDPVRVQIHARYLEN